MFIINRNMMTSGGNSDLFGGPCRRKKAGEASEVEAPWSPCQMPGVAVCKAIVFKGIPLK